MRIVIIFILLITSLSVRSQTIEGVVKDKQDKVPIDGVVITLLDKNNNTVAYCFTDKDGKYSIQSEEKMDSLFLNVSFLGYETQIIFIKSRSKQPDIFLQVKDFQLKEVSVKARTLWLKEDTIAYNVAALQTQNDRKIGDVLKKIPGVEVSNSGGITYRGFPINKFYIEGLDLLNSRYGIATNNVPVDAVSTVEVIENHQPVKMFKDMIPSMDAAINLKLKAGKKFRPVGTVEAGGGYGFDDYLWTLNAFGIQVEKKSQTIVMYKTNNSGKNIVSEFDDQTIGTENLKSFTLPSALISSPITRSMPLTESRYLFNKTHVLTLNNLNKVSDDSHLRVNVNYINNCKEETVNQYSSYYIEGDNLIINELESLNNRLNLLDGAVTYNNNSTNQFINNPLKGVAGWDNTHSGIQTQSPVSEEFDLRNYYIQNDLDYSVKTKNRIWNINSFMRYSSLPRQLNVQTESLTSDQSILRIGFYTQNNTYYSFKRGLSSFRVDLSLEAAFDNLKTDLKYHFLSDSIRNDIKSDFLKTFIQPQYSYNNGAFLFSVKIPLVLDWLGVQDNEYKTNTEYSYLFVNPSANLRYKYEMWELIAQVRYNQDIGDIAGLIPSYVMTGYRTLRNTSGILSKDKSLMNTFSLAYKDALNGFYFNLGGYYRKTERNMMSKQRFINELSFSSNDQQSSQSKFRGANGYIGKNFYNIGTTFTLTANYARIESKKWQQGDHYPLQSEIWSLIPKVNFSVKRYFNVICEMVFSSNSQSITNSTANKYKSSFAQIAQKTSVSYFPNKKIEFKLQSEYFSDEIAEGIKTELVFLDCGFSYRHKKWEINFSWDNILNQKEYSYLTYRDLDSFSYSYRLRPQSLLATITFNY
ncbi:MAG: TonB-dependent receptor [Dysgonamonadaceae bacterium]|jgi:hypothetical protein|nr:TonB-dependent receptor [Dysgonamonadaceae bacterium]